MKNIVLYFSILMSILITACSNEDIIIPTPQTGVSGETCEVSFWASIPETLSASRGLLEEATAESVATLKLLVFDAASGLYLYESEATLSYQTLDGEIHKGKYTAQLQLSDAPRIIHFVANVDDVPFQANEIAVLSQLSKSNNEDAYWQKVEVQSITAKVDESGKVVTKELTDDNDNKTTIAVANIPTEMENVKLVRNFARITLSVKDGVDFKLDGFVIVNTANSGSVAPYLNEPINGSYFIDYNTDNVDGSALTAYEALIDAGYTGVVSSSINKDIPTTYDNNPKYVYERNQVTNPLFIIARRNVGTQESPSYKYYKIDILKIAEDNDEANSYYKILRNFSYDIIINSVTGEGYNSAIEAASKTASNNLSASVELKDLKNIAFGNERLFVSKTEIVWTSAQPVTFKYKYLNNNANANGTIQTLIWNKDYIGGKVYDDAISSCSYAIANTELDSDGFSTITITHTGLPTSGYKAQEVTIKAGSLSRTINIILIQPYISEIGCSADSGLPEVPSSTPTIETTSTSPVSVYFSLPEGLPESVFPLTFILSPSEHSITPASTDMPTISLLDHSNGVLKAQKYGFKKVVEWGTGTDQYNGSYSVIECPFKTSFANSATMIYLYNEYFDLNKTMFINDNVFLFNLGKMSKGNDKCPTNDDTLVTIYGNDDSVLGIATWGELQSGTTIIVDKNTYDINVNQDNQNNKICYFGYTTSGDVSYATDILNVNQATAGLALNFN